MVITDDGQALVDQFLPEVVALQTAALAELTEPQRRQLLKLLATVRAGLTSLDTDEVIRAAHPGASRGRSDAAQPDCWLHLRGQTLDPDDRSSAERSMG